MTPPRGGAERWLDIAALVLVVVGAALYAYAHVGMQGIIDSSGGAAAPSQGFEGIARWNRMRLISNGALGAIAVGIGVGVWSYVLHGRRRTTAPPAAPSAPDE